MLSYLSNILKRSDEYRREAQDLLDKENNFLDEEDNEKISDSKGSYLEYNHNANANKNDLLTTPSCSLPSNTIAECSKRTGVITELSAQHGVIDKCLTFDKQAAKRIFQDLHIGCTIQYLAYQLDNIVKVIKIIDILEHNWENSGATKISEVLESLKLEKPTYFNTQLRTIYGNIKERLPEAIVVDTDCGDLYVELDNVEINFIPKKGDNVCLHCNVQLDEGFVDKQGEILDVINVTPTRIESDVQCIVERVFEDIAVLSGNAYVFKVDVPMTTGLHLGDVVKADLIECNYSHFSRRAIKLTFLEKNFGQMKNFLPSTSMNSKLYTITLHGENRFIFTEQWKKQNVTIKVKNTSNRIVELNEVIVKNTEDSQIRVLEPVSSRKLEIGGELSVIFEVHTKFVGESQESFKLIFDTFKIQRSLTIILCKTSEEAKQAQLRLMAADQLIVNGKTTGQRSRSYACQVWSNKTIVVPGQCFGTKRRFLHHRLLPCEVPAKMREIVLTTEKYLTMMEILATEYPCLKEGLSFENYVQRFGILLHLEEIYYTILFRNFDRERAHFQRDGQYLSLQIENLAERRPSLVLGDTLRAVSPFENPNESKSFEGVVHKVLFNRILLKFNPSFQEKYNGEDYRLTFFFSRYILKKQHYAIARICTKLRKQFLFPNKVEKTEHPQADIIFKDDDMYLYNNKLPWFNTTLNIIQKLAVFNILRGESTTMPYIIFGPPGTGKTVTLVEAILQVVRNLPNARLLVGAPSNSSADLITKRIIDSNVLTPGDFVRLVSQNQIEKDLIPPELMSYCATGDIGMIDDQHDSMIVSESGLKLRCQRKFLVQRRVTISTCNTLGNFLQMDFPPDHFTHVFIDEAGQCSEPETVVPIALLPTERGQIVLAGDPHQLQPISTSRIAQSYGMNVSLLERILQRIPYCKDMQRFPQTSGYNPSVLTKLLYNYRALPSIMCVYSRMFYDNELLPMISEEDSREAKLLAELQSVFEPHTDMPRTHGTFFHGIMGENMQDSDSPSWYNPSEARELFLFAISLYRRGVKPDQIGILTPYAKQVKTIRNMFISANISMPKIGSVEEFQGQERDITLISTVRSSQSALQSDKRFNLGFVSSEKRMNVATSRARCMMVIFGNPQLLSIDACWRQLIVYCANNNAYFGCELPKSILSQEEDADDANSEG